MTRPAGLDEDWRARSACTDADPETFFPEHYRDEARLREARDHCDVCPVWEACLTLVLRVPASLDRDGVFAGLSPAERQDLRGLQPRLFPADAALWKGGDAGHRRARARDPYESEWDDDAQSA